MSFGKVFGFKGNARTTVLLAIAAENGLDIELIETNPDFELTSDYLRLNPLKRIPTFRATDGWVLTEVIAIASYFARQNPQTLLLGRSQREQAEVIRWMSFVNSEVQPHLANWFKPLVHRRPYNEENVKAAQVATNGAITILELLLATNNGMYLVGGNITLADLLAASSLSRGFQYVFDEEWQQVYPNVTKWFKHMVKQPIWQRVVPEPVIVKKAVQYSPKSNTSLAKL